MLSLLLSLLLVLALLLTRSRSCLFTSPYFRIVTQVLRLRHVTEIEKMLVRLFRSSFNYDTYYMSA